MQYKACSAMKTQLAPIGAAVLTIGIFCASVCKAIVNDQAEVYQSLYGRKNKHELNILKRTDSGENYVEESPHKSISSLVLEARMSRSELNTAHHRNIGTIHNTIESTDNRKMFSSSGKGKGWSNDDVNTSLDICLDSPTVSRNKRTDH